LLAAQHYFSAAAQSPEAGWHCCTNSVPLVAGELGGVRGRVVDRTARPGVAYRYLPEEQATAGQRTLIASTRLRPYRVLPALAR
jgi:hypothetical protein